MLFRYFCYIWEGYRSKIKINENETTDTGDQRRHFRYLFANIIFFLFLVAEVKGFSSLERKSVSSVSFDDLAEDLGTNWRELGRILGIQENKLEYFDTKNERLRDKGMAMLVEWMKRRADATVGKTGMEGLFKADEGTYSYGTELKE